MANRKPIIIGLRLYPKLSRRWVRTTLFACAGTTTTRRTTTCICAGRFEAFGNQVINVTYRRAEKQKHYNIL